MLVNHLLRLDMLPLDNASRERVGGSGYGGSWKMLLKPGAYRYDSYIKSIQLFNHILAL